MAAIPSSLNDWDPLIFFNPNSGILEAFAIFMVLHLWKLIHVIIGIVDI